MFFLSVCVAEDPASRARKEKKRFRSRQTTSKQGTNHSDSYSAWIDLPRSNAVAREARTFAYAPLAESAYSRSAPTGRSKLQGRWVLAPSSSSSLLRQHGFCGIVLAQLWDKFADVPNPFRPFFFTCLKDCRLTCEKEILDFSILWLEQPRSRRWTGSFLQILASFCVSQWRKWQFWMTPPATVARKTRDCSRHWKWIFLFSGPRRTGRRF